MDIIRRVLQSYFGYQVQFVQNVTDIDDKVKKIMHRFIAEEQQQYIADSMPFYQIILRARQQYLFNNLKNSTDGLNTDLIHQVEKYWNDYATSKLATVEGAAVEAISDWAAFETKMTPERLAQAVLADEKFKMHFSALVSFCLDLR